MQQNPSFSRIRESQVINGIEGKELPQLGQIVFLDQLNFYAQGFSDISKKVFDEIPSVF